MVGQQCFDPPTFAAGDHRLLTAPEIAMMNQDGVGLQLDSLVNQCLTGGDASDDFFYRRSR